MSSGYCLVQTLSSPDPTPMPTWSGGGGVTLITPNPYPEETPPLVELITP